MMKRPLLLLLLFVLGLLAFVRGKEDPIDRFVSSLQKWTTANPQEKVYLHMDKPYYALGDTIWFKGYVTIGSRHQLSKMSGALYVELINEKDSLLSSVKLPVTAGMAMGDFTLGDNYEAGNYRIRAYTQWMRNAGEDYFFDKTFAVGDPLSVGQASRVVAAATGNTLELREKKKEKELSGTNTDVQFFPEGGNMVNELMSRVGFKAVGTDGKGAYVKGTIVDDTGKEITSFESTHAGMGVFNLLPEAGKNYTANMTFGDGSEKTAGLPKASAQGYNLAVYQPGGDSVLVRINASPAMYTSPKPVNLMVQSGGETIFASQIKVSQRINSVWLKKSDFPSGIAQFTLFGEGSEPLNERIAFIKSYDRMLLELGSVKKVYSSRERIDIDLEAMNSSGKLVAGNFSVSVIDENKVPSDEDSETSIFSSILLSSDLKGYIEKPNFYFTKDTIQTNKALDNLMLTQGYRRFVWKDIINKSTDQDKPLYRAESLGTEISGRVLTLGGKPVINGTLTLMSLTPGFLEVTRTDTGGRFRYEPIMLADSLRFALQARTDKKSKKVEVILDSIPKQGIGKNKNKRDFEINITELTETYLENSRKQDELIAKMGGMSRAIRLREIKIKAKKSDFGAERIYNLNGKDHYDQIVRSNELENCNNLRGCVEGKLRGVVFKTIQMPNCPPVSYAFSTRSNSPLESGERDDNRQSLAGAMLIVLDGKPFHPSDTDCGTMGGLWDFNDPNSADIETIEVLRTPGLTGIYGTKGKDGVIIITTKRGRNANRYNPDIVNIRPKGFNKAREFYAPRYDRPNVSQQLPDLRSTIYWNAKLKTYASGRTKFSYFNADGPGKYKVVVEGINAAGELGRQVYRYEVTGSAAVHTSLEIGDGKSTELVKAMQGLQQRMPAEKLYVHTDKSYYNLGDTLWFKAYLFDATSLAASKKSGILYVELNDDTAEAVRRISIPIKDGIGYAQIPLTRKIFHEGGYTFRAYTNWMQNFGDNYFFSKRFYLGVPTTGTWLVQSSSKTSKVLDKDKLQVDLLLSRSDQSAVGLKNVEIRVIEGDRQLYKENKQTAVDGKLELIYNLDARANGRNIRVEILNLNKSEGNQRLVIPLNINRDQKIDLQFLPEGGYLVAGLKSMVGVKAIGENGKGINVSGKVYDSKDNPVSSFTSLYQGMGSFEFTPKSGEHYTVRLIQPELVEKTFKFPAVKTEGVVLNVLNEEDSDTLKVNIQASPDLFSVDSTWYLMAISRGAVTYATALDLKKESYQIPKSLFPAGITRLSLLRNKTVLNDRMVYIDRDDQLKIGLKASKNQYLKRDSADIEIVVQNKSGKPVKGTFSVSVTDDSQVKPDSTGNFSITTALLLRSDLKGNIETPGYYLNRNNSGRWQALDNLMLTQGWTGHDWKDAFKTDKTVEFEAEKYFKVAGMVKNLTNNPVSGAQMLISSQKPFFIKTTITDVLGKYAFENLPEIDSGSFFIQARTPKGKTMNFGEVTVDRFKPAAIRGDSAVLIQPWYVNSEVTQLNYVKNVAAKADEKNLKSTGIALKEVKIISNKIIKGSYNRNMSNGADLIFDEQDIKESGTMNLYALLKQKIPGIKVIMEDGLPTLKLNKYMVVIEIDGGGLPLQLNANPTTDELIEELNSFKVAGMLGLEVMYSRKYTGKYLNPPPRDPFRGEDINASQLALKTGSQYQLDPKRLLPLLKPNGDQVPLFENTTFFQINYPERAGYLEFRANVLTNTTRDIAVIGLTTKTGRGWFRNNRNDYVTLRPLPLMKPAEFYSPKYSKTEADAAEPDFRSTIYWKPDVITDTEGKARIAFYTSDVTGKYTINIQGADMDGQIGSGTSQLKVESQ